MSPRSCLLRCAGLALLLGSSLSAQAPAPSTAPALPLQQQIDELRTELREIKALLQERSARMEAPIAPKRPEVLSVNVHGEPFRGSALARVAILEYSDFDCSYCAQYAITIYPLLDHAYVQAGKVKYFFRDLPGPEHPAATFKARLARCAGEQEKFWEGHDHLFRNQVPFDNQAMERLLKNVGLEEKAFKACIQSDRYIEILQRSAQGARRMGLNGTPAFLIGTLSEDGRLLTATKVFLGAESYEAFRTVLDELLKAPQAN